MSGGEVDLQMSVRKPSRNIAEESKSVRVPGLSLSLIADPGSECTYSVAQLPSEFSHPQPLGSLKSLNENVAELEVVHPVIMQDLGNSECSGNTSNHQFMALGLSENPLDVFNGSPRISVLRIQKVEFDLDPPEIL